MEVKDRLHRTFRFSFRPLFSSFKDNFFLEEEEKSASVRAKTKLELCPTNCRRQDDCDGHCGKLHLCKFYLLSNSCKMIKKNCDFSHDIHSPHNINLLRKNFLDHLPIEKLRVLFKDPRNRCQVTLPPFCRNHMAGKECISEHGDCQYLHMCKEYVSGSCLFGRHCRKSHNLGHPVTKEILEKYGIDTHRPIKDILAYLKVCFSRQGGESISASNNSSVQSERSGFGGFGGFARSKSNPNLNKEFSLFDVPKDSDESPKASSKDSLQICLYNLRGTCKYRENCFQQHKNMMYQWQSKNSSGDWVDFSPAQNVRIEENYANVNLSDCDIKFSRQPKIHVDFRRMVSRRMGSLSDIRRLSTVSTAVQKFQPLATEYKWYWQDQRDQWIQYGEQNVTGYSAMLDSNNLELNYQENPCGQMKFQTRGHDYIMDFQRMIQKNVIHKTERAVRRRPTFVNTTEMESRKKRSADTRLKRSESTPKLVTTAPSPSSAICLPTSWSIEKSFSADAINDHFKLVICGTGSSEYTQLGQLFFDSMPKSCTIGCIKRIENGELWMNYIGKRQRMARKRKDGNITEMQLFHGTNESIVEAICRQGFDFRFSGSKTGHVYGKGSYFAKMAQTADSYTDYGSKKYMFVVRVLVGAFAKGETTYVRPPPKDPKDPFELYDSCVDSIQNPNIFVIFTFDQVYPEYLIEYQKGKG